MNAGDAGKAKQQYRRYLERQYDRGEALEILQFLGLEEIGGEPLAGSVDRIAGVVEKPGALEAILRARCEEVWRLLVELTDAGDRLSSALIDSILVDKSPVEKSAAFIILRQLGLLKMEGAFEPPAIFLHPLARHLVGDQMRAFREERWRQAGPAAAAVIPLRQNLILCLNLIRGNPIRVNQDSRINSRDRDRGNALFQGFSSGQPGQFECSISALLGLEAASLDASDKLEYRLGGETPILEWSLADLRRELLARRRGSSEFGILLLEFLQTCETEFPEGWVPQRALIQGAFGLDTLAVVCSSLEIFDPFLQIRELHFLELVESCITKGDIEWLRIAPAGKELLESLDRGLPDKPVSPSAGAEGPGSGAIVLQPNFDVLVPLDAPARAHWIAGAAARLETIDAMCRYVLDKDHARYVFSRENLNVEDWLRQIAAFTRHGIPENVPQTLRGWLGGRGAIEIHSGTVFHFEAKSGDVGDAARAAIEAAAKKLKAIRLAPGIFLADRGVKKSAILDALQRQGLVSGEEVERAGKRWSPAGFNAARRKNHALLADDLALGKISRQRVSQEVEKSWSQVESPSELHQPDREDSEDRIARINELIKTGDLVEMTIVNGPEKRCWLVYPRIITQRGQRDYLLAECQDSMELRAFPMESIIRIERTKNT